MAESSNRHTVIGADRRRPDLFPSSALLGSSTFRHDGGQLHAQRCARFRIHRLLALCSVSVSDKSENS